MDWSEIKQKAKFILEERKLSQEYYNRLNDELYEIEKQGANSNWCDLINSGVIWDTNPKGLVLLWLFNLTPIDPIIGVNKIMIGSENGDVTDAIVIQLSNGKEIAVSEHTLVLTNYSFIKALDLKVDNVQITNIRKERRKLTEVRSDIYVFNGMSLKAGPHPIKHIWVYQTDFP